MMVCSAMMDRRTKFTTNSGHLARGLEHWVRGDLKARYLYK